MVLADIIFLQYFLKLTTLDKLTGIRSIAFTWQSNRVCDVCKLLDVRASSKDRLAKF